MSARQCVSERAVRLLYEAAAEGNAARVKKVVDRAHAHGRVFDRSAVASALDIAATRGDMEIVTALVDVLDGDVGATDESSLAFADVFSTAVKQVQPEVAEVLLPFAYRKADTIDSAFFYGLEDAARCAYGSGVLADEYDEHHEPRSRTVVDQKRVRDRFRRLVLLMIDYVRDNRDRFTPQALLRCGFVLVRVRRTVERPYCAYGRPAVDGRDALLDDLEEWC